MKLNKSGLLRLLMLAVCFTAAPLHMFPVTLWVGESYTYDVGSSVVGSVYNMSWSTDGGYISLTGSGFYRNVKVTQYFSGQATVTVEWDYKLGSSMQHTRRQLTVDCRDNKVSISPTRLELSVGQTATIGYRHQYDNAYTSNANAYFSCGSSCVEVDQSGNVRAVSPGTAYINVYSKISSESPYCLVTVKEVEPERAKISDVSIYADESKSLDVAVSPANATVKSRRWEIVEGSDVISLTGSGTLSGLMPGTAKIRCTVNGSVVSNIANVTVEEPPFRQTSVYPDDNAVGQNVFTVPSIGWSHTLFEGDRLADCYMAEVSGSGRIAGETRMEGTAVKFISSKPLKPQTVYRFVVPAGAVRNKWGTAYDEESSVTFTTGDRDKIKLSVSPEPGSFMTTASNSVSITASVPEAAIYYTLDGTIPTVSSTRYTEPFSIKGDVTLKCFATADGYDDSDVLEAAYNLSHCEVYSAFPDDNVPLYVYDSIVPYVRYTGIVEKDSNFRKISLKDSEGNDVEGRPCHYGNIVAFVPDGQLEYASEYTLSIPSGALKADRGESNEGFVHKFKTRNMLREISLAGDETVMTIDEKGMLSAWGLDYTGISHADGFFSFTDNHEMWQVSGNTSTVDGGTTHRLSLDGDGNLYGWGRQYCGEIGLPSSSTPLKPVKIASDVKKVSAGGQTTAYIDRDDNLWMLGRNDFGQLGDSTTLSRNVPVKVMDNVADVAAGFRHTLAVTADGDVWAWGRNDSGQLGDKTIQDRCLPVKVMDNAVRVFASKYGNAFSAAITDNGELWMWGNNADGQIDSSGKDVITVPFKICDDVMDVSLGSSHTLILKNDWSLLAMGNDSYGQLLAGNKSADAGKPVMHGVADMAAGRNASLVLMLDGSVKVAGENSHNILGDGKAVIKDPSVILEGNGRSNLESVRLLFPTLYMKPDDDAVAIFGAVPENSDYQIVTWESDDSGIAEVSEKGVVHANDYGKTKINLTLTDRWGNVKTASCVAWVMTEEEAVGISSNEISEWTASVSYRTLRIKDSVIGEHFTIYNMHGMAVDHIVSSGDIVECQLPVAGVYIVVSETKQQKVICR